MSFLNLKTKMKRKFKVITTTSNHNFDIAPNRINRDFYSSNPNDKYVGLYASKDTIKKYIKNQGSDEKNYKKIFEGQLKFDL